MSSSFSLSLHSAWKRLTTHKPYKYIIQTKVANKIVHTQDGMANKIAAYYFPAISIFCLLVHISSLLYNLTEYIRERLFLCCCNCLE